MSQDNFWFWHNDDESAVLAAFLAQHGLVSGIGDDTENGQSTVSFVVGFDSEAPDPFALYVCALCGTSVSERGDAGWRHDVGWHERGGCTSVQPRELPRWPTTKD